MRKLLFSLIFLTITATSCVATVDRYGVGVSIAPALPVVVELESPYYVYGGYYYYYHGDRWYYSRARGGPWVALPRDRYPREIRNKGRGYEQDRGGRGRRDRN